MRSSLLHSAREPLRAASGLTPAEAAVAAARGVALATVRTQAQQAYRRTRVR